MNKKPETESADVALTLKNGIFDGVNQCFVWIAIFFFNFNVDRTMKWNFCLFGRQRVDFRQSKRVMCRGEGKFCWHDYDNRIINVAQIIWRVCRWLKWSRSQFKLVDDWIQKEETPKVKHFYERDRLKGRQRNTCMLHKNFKVERRKTWNLIWNCVPNGWSV